MTGCTSSKNAGDPQQWSDEELDKWFNSKDWLGSSSFQPDASIDKRDLAVSYHKHPDRWKKALDFLKTEDLQSKAPGTYDLLDNKDVFAIIQEYNTKNHEDAQYESHRVYTDLQYIISGEELIGRTDLSTTSVNVPYDDEKDIAFYSSEQGRTLSAKPGTFFLFFPNDAHRPGMKTGDNNTPVKKLVIKIKN